MLCASRLCCSFIKDTVALALAFQRRVELLALRGPSTENSFHILLFIIAIPFLRYAGRAGSSSSTP